MKFLLPFQEDSSLIFASRVAPKLRAAGHETEFLHIIDRNGEDGISERQFRQNIGDQTVPSIDINNVISSGVLTKGDGILVSRVVKPMRHMLESPSFKSRKDRPCFMAFQPGLEFTPSRGFSNRRDFDAVFLNKRQHIGLFREAHPARYWQHVSFGHPYFIFPRKWHFDDPARKDIYFFAQAVSPRTLKSRQHIVKVLEALARAYPEREVVIKLRHLPKENTRHVHQEEHDYPGIVARLAGGAPANLKYTDCSMDEALAHAGVAITCTSTAAMDAISGGVPTAVYLDYVDFVTDGLREPMRNEFAASGVITPLGNLLDLRINRPGEDWMSVCFRGQDLYEEIAETVRRFRSGQEMHWTYSPPRPPVTPA